LLVNLDRRILAESGNCGRRSGTAAEDADH
jgi:hypothetical protein